jgi:hypothetical protein
LGSGFWEVDEEEALFEGEEGEEGVGARASQPPPYRLDDATVDYWRGLCSAVTRWAGPAVHL